MWLCVFSQASGSYKNYKRHAKRCPHCSPDRLREITAAEQSDKENRIFTTAETESSQSAVTPDSSEALDESLTHVFAVSPSHYCSRQRPCKNRGHRGR